MSSDCLCFWDPPNARYAITVLAAVRRRCQHVGMSRHLAEGIGLVKHRCVGPQAVAAEKQQIARLAADGALVTRTVVQMRHRILRTSAAHRRRHSDQHDPEKPGRRGHAHRAIQAAERRRALRLSTAAT